MKVCLISYGFTDYVTQLANSLGDLGLKVLLCTTKKVKTNKNVSVYLIKQRRIRNPFSIVETYKLLKKIKTYNPKVIHIQFSYPWLVPIMPILSKNYEIITTIHDVVPHIGEESLHAKILNKCIVKYSKKLIIHSEKLKKLFIKNYNFKKPIFVIPHGAFEIIKIKKKYKEKNNYILFFGRIYKYKGLEYLIKAEPLIRSEIQSFKIVIAGKGENFKKYEKLIKNKKNFIIYNRYIKNKEILRLFQEASLIVLPYIEASQSGVIPMAYKFKKPVIATNVGALSDVVINEKTGFLIKPKNTKILADKIIWMLKNPRKRKKMGIEGYKFSKRELSWNKIAKKTLKAYETSY